MNVIIVGNFYLCIPLLQADESVTPKQQYGYPKMAVKYP